LLKISMISKGGFTVREAREEDIEAVIDINKRTLPENYPRFYFKLHLHNFPKAFLVAEMNGEIVGYIMCRVEYDSLYTNPSVVGRKGHIVSLAVLPKARRRGVATALMKKAMEAMKNVYGADEFYLEVRVSNMPAISLYKKLGFKAVKVLQKYYGDGEDAYLMARPA